MKLWLTYDQRKPTGWKLGDKVRYRFEGEGVEPLQGQILRIGKNQLVIEDSDRNLWKCRIDDPRLGCLLFEGL